MVRLFAILLILSVSAQVKAQEDRCFTQIIDAETGEPLVFATVQVISKSIGTVSDLKGCFELQLESINPNDSIEISYLGYKSIIILQSSLIQHSKIALEPKPTMLADVTLKGNAFDLKEFMQEVALNYQINRRKTAHISKATFEKYGKIDDRYVQYTISSGYALYYGDRTDIARLALYEFVPERTNKSFRRPEWIKSSKRFRNERTDVPLGGEIGFNAYQYFEEIGPQSSHTNQYKYVLDSVYQIGNEEVYKVRFNANPTFDLKAQFSKGHLFIYANSKKIIRAEVTGKLLWSPILHERMIGNMEFEYVYYGLQPFLFRISTQYKKKKIEERTILQIDLQKFDEVYIKDELIWYIADLADNPIISPSKELIKRAALGIDFDELQKDLGFKESLWEQYMSEKGKNYWDYTYTVTDDISERKEKAYKAMEEYKKFF